MARLILKSPYLKPASKSRAANHLRYIATREGVVKPEDPKRQLPATQYQQAAVAELLKEYPDTAELHEYQDYQQSPTRENADEFIMRVAETHGELFESRNKYVDYIATRPGAVHVAEHGLFTDEGKPVVLDQVADEVASHNGNVWTHIISLRREDADRLGYNNVNDWMDLIRRQRSMLAKQMNIDPKNFRWYAAFHDKDHHPHVHVMAWSSKPGEAWLSEKGIEGIKSAMAKDIFQQDLVQIYQRQTQHRDALRQDGRALAAEIVREIKAGGYENQAMQELLLKLSERLKMLSGKKVYGYLPADAKATVDRIVDELAKDPRIAQLYDLWYDQRETVLATYKSEMPERIPLSRNSEFRSIKNAVIAEAAKLTMEEPKPGDEQHNNTPNWEALQLYHQAKELLGADPQAAVRLLAESAEHGYEWAQYRLGKMLLYRQGVERDTDLAVQLLTASAAQGNTHAQALLDRWEEKQAQGPAEASSHLLGQLADLITTRILKEPQPKDSRVVVESKLWREEQEKKAGLGLKM